MRGRERDQQPSDGERAASYEVSSEHERHDFSVWAMNPAPPAFPGETVTKGGRTTICPWRFSKLRNGTKISSKS